MLTLYERLGDAGLRSAVTPFLIYRGRTRHELGLEGLLGRVATAARFHHAVWGPDELFYGELYASRKVPCKPTFARPDARDDYSACVGAELVERDLYDFMLFSLPDNDHYSHRHGPEASEVSITHADGCIAELVAPAGGLDAFLEQNAVIVMADHSQSSVTEELDLVALLEDEWHVLRPNEDSPETAELAIGPSSRAAGVWILREGSRGRKLHDADPRDPRRPPRRRPALLARARRRAGRPHRRRGPGRRRGRDRPRLGRAAALRAGRPHARHHASPIAAASPGRSTASSGCSAPRSATGRSRPAPTRTRSPASGPPCTAPSPPT